jgi:hypothetical protein
MPLQGPAQAFMVRCARSNWKQPDAWQPASVWSATWW